MLPGEARALPGTVRPVVWSGPECQLALGTCSPRSLPPPCRRRKKAPSCVGGTAKGFVTEGSERSHYQPRERRKYKMKLRPEGGAGTRAAAWTSGGHRQELRRGLLVSHPPAPCPRSCRLRCSEDPAGSRPGRHRPPTQGPAPAQAGPSPSVRHTRLRVLRPDNTSGSQWGGGGARLTEGGRGRAPRTRSRRRDQLSCARSSQPPPPVPPLGNKQL